MHDLNKQLLSWLYRVCYWTLLHVMSFNLQMDMRRMLHKAAGFDWPGSSQQSYRPQHTTKF